MEKNNSLAYALGYLQNRVGSLDEIFIYRRELFISPGRQGRRPIYKKAR